MRKLLLLRGLPGCGKSAFVAQRGLEAYTLSADGLRMMYASPILEADGGMRIPAEYDRKVWQELLHLLEGRMTRGELVVVDAMHTHPRSFASYQRLVSEHRYQVACIDFSQIPFDVCQERNLARPAYKVVPLKEMERMQANMQRTKLPPWVKSILPEELDDFLAVQPKNVSEYKAVHHIGDIQGCFDPLQAYFQQHGINDDELYIFVGDYLDRGPQNAEVMNWLLDNYHRPNFIFVEGNHEAHLRNWTKGIKARSVQFNQATALQLEAAGISPKKVYGFLYKLRDMFLYTYGEKRVLVTHGGLSALPRDLAFINTRQLIKGAGLYEEVYLADDSFVRTTSDNTYQVHGHRNPSGRPTQTNARCFNLEGKIEFGGELRVIVLDKNGFKEQSVASSLDATDTLLEPIDQRPAVTSNVPSLIASMRASKDIYEKPQAGTNISSFNFNRDVFYKKDWDAFNVQARGLFINTHTNTIVARAYEKFFNLDERPETQLANLQQNLHFPVRAWVKENGYLGLVGYDAEQGDLVFASKSSLSSEYAGWLRQQFDVLVPPLSEKRQALTHYLQAGTGKTLVFEVIEPHNDPHIVAYSEPSLVLLDIVDNTVSFQAAPTRERMRIAELIGCKVKQHQHLIQDAQALQAWLKELEASSYEHPDEHIEGYVLEDAHGFMVKIKLPWYTFWRQMRTQLEKLQAGKPPQLPEHMANRDRAEAFVHFIAQKSPEELQTTSIVRLRDEFLKLQR